MKFVVTPPDNPSIESYAYDSEVQTLEVKYKGGKAEEVQEVSTGAFCIFATADDLSKAFEELKAR